MSFFIVFSHSAKQRVVSLERNDWSYRPTQCAFEQSAFLDFNITVPMLTIQWKLTSRISRELSLFLDIK